MAGCTVSQKENFTATSEFEDQEYIWLSWVESGFLGGEPFYFTILNAMKEITPYCKVRLFYGPQGAYSREQLEDRIYEKLMNAKIDTSRVELFYNEQYYGAIQDPGPIFLRNGKGELALTDFKFYHPDERTESIDRNITAHSIFRSFRQIWSQREAPGKRTAREPCFWLSLLNWTETDRCQKNKSKKSIKMFWVLRK